MHQKSKYNLFLTGGTGFFGRSILLEKIRGNLADFKITILSRSPESFLCHYPEFSMHEDIDFFRGNIENFSFPERKFDFIIHGAAPSTIETADTYHNTIVKGTKRVLEFAALCGIQKMLYISSGAVYLPNTFIVDRIKEDFPCQPVSAYGQAKYEAEQLCSNSGLPIVTARCFSFTGPYILEKRHLAISSFISSCLENKPINIYGDGTDCRSYMHTSDLVHWLFTLLLSGRPGNVYNVGSDSTVSIYDLAQTVCNLLNPRLPIHVCKFDSSSRPATCYIPDISKCIMEFGLQIKINLQNAILGSLNTTKNHD